MADIHVPIREIRDPVHGFVKLTDAEISIVNSRTFQRLRDIRQLAVAQYVYPGAVHTRFEHSIGCLHLSDRVLSLLDANEGREDRPKFVDVFSSTPSDLGRYRAILRLASLLHDLGHPPFSHSGEYLLPFNTKDGSESKRVTHEDMTVRLICETEIADIIKRQYKNRAVTVEDVIAVAVNPAAAGTAHGTDDVLWMLNDILTWDFGTDRMDYLLRDAHHSGQPTGTFDYNKLLDSLTLVHPNLEEDRRGFIGIEGNGWLVAEQMIVSRYLMYMSLYFHKTKRVLEKHMERFLRTWCQSRFQSDFLPVETDKYQVLGESEVFAAVNTAAQDPENPGYEDARAFTHRKHFRLAVELVLSDNARIEYVALGKDTAAEREIVVERHPDRIRLDKFRAFVNNLFGDAVIVDTADHSASKLFSRGGEVSVLLNGTVRSLSRLSEIARGMPSRVWRCRVYARENRRTEITAACNKWLAENPVERKLLNG